MMSPKQHANTAALTLLCEDFAFAKEVKLAEIELSIYQKLAMKLEEKWPVFCSVLHNNSVNLSSS